MRKRSPTFTHALDVVVMNQHETLVWHGLPPRTTRGRSAAPQVIGAPDERREHRHVRAGQERHLHHRAADDPKYFDAVAHELTDAERILLIGHGTGRSNMTFGFLEHATTHHPEVAHRVIGHLTSNLSALDHGELLDVARRWYATYLTRT